MTIREITHEELIDLYDAADALQYDMSDRHELKQMRDYLSAVINTMDKLLSKSKAEIDVIIADYDATEDY